MGKHNDVLNPYVILVDFIAGIVGPNCEVALHDCSQLDESIIAIKNNHISGRKQGGPLTDLGLKILKEKSYETKDYLLNYPSETKDGKKLRSSTFFIKDPRGHLLGMLCINIDLTGPIIAKNFIDSFIQGCVENSKVTVAKDPLNMHENFSSNIDELIYTTITNTIGGLSIPPERLSPEEKTNIVQSLNEKGVFLLKGAVSEVAKALKVSENTVYRYLNKMS